MAKTQEEIREQNRRHKATYREKHREALREKSKEYRANNLEKCKEAERKCKAEQRHVGYGIYAQVVCSCGSKVLKNSMARHLQTRTHAENLLERQTIEKV